METKSLILIGKVLGMDIWIDISQVRDAKRKLKLVSQILRKSFESGKDKK